MTRLRLPMSLDLATRPTRTEFLGAYTRALAAAGDNKQQLKSKEHALRWFLAMIDKAPHEMTSVDFRRFMTKAASMGTRHRRMAALRFAIELAFDQMCGHAITADPAEREEKPDDARDRELSRERLIQCLAGELGMTPNDVERVRWSNVHFDSQMIVLPSHTGHSRRRIALTRRANDLLSAAKPSAGGQESFVFARPRPLPPRPSHAPDAPIAPG